jgi:hypothetical protein
MKSVAIVIILFSCILTWISRAADLTPAEDTIRQILGKSAMNADLSTIPAEQKDAVIAKLQEVARLKGVTGRVFSSHWES